MDLQARLETALQAVDAAGRFIATSQKSSEITVDFKEDGSPVTNVDRFTETQIRTILLQNFEADGFNGEEFGEIVGSSGYTWECDPVDGTNALRNGEKTLATSLSLRYEDRTVLGIVYNPLTNELFFGVEGADKPAYLNGVALPLRKHIDLSESVLNYQIGRSNVSQLTALLDLWVNKDIGKLVTTGGSVAYSLAQVAAGFQGVYVGASKKQANAWDIAAGMYLVERVGGKAGQFNNGHVLVAANTAQLYDQTIDALRQSSFDLR